MQDVGAVRVHLVDLRFLYVPVVESYLATVRRVKEVVVGRASLIRNEALHLADQEMDSFHLMGTAAQGMVLGLDTVGEKRQVEADTKTVQAAEKMAARAERKADCTVV